MDNTDIQKELTEQNTDNAAHDNDKRIHQKASIQMLCVFVFVFIITGIAGSVLYMGYQKTQTARTLSIAIDDTESAIALGVSDYLLRLTTDVAYTDMGDSFVCITNISEDTVKDMNGDGVFSSADVDEYFVEFAKVLGYREINIIDDSGIIIYSNIPEYYGYDMASDLPGNEQAYDFFTNIKEAGFYVQGYRGTSYNVNNMMRYAGIRLDNDCYLCKAGSYLQIGFDADKIREDIDYRVPASAANHRVGENGMIIVCLDTPVNDEYVTVGITAVGAHGNVLEEQFGSKGFDYTPGKYYPDMLCTGEIYGIPSHFMFRHFDNYFIVATIPVEEAHESRNLTIVTLLLVEFVAFLLLYIVLYFAVLKQFSLQARPKKARRKKSPVI